MFRLRLTVRLCVCVCVCVCVAATTGADVNVADPGGWTALHFAASTGSTAVARLLLTKVCTYLTESPCYSCVCVLQTFFSLDGPRRYLPFQSLTTQPTFRPVHSLQNRTSACAKTNADVQHCTLPRKRGAQRHFSRCELIVLLARMYFVLTKYAHVCANHL